MSKGFRLGEQKTLNVDIATRINRTQPRADPNIYSSQAQTIAESRSKARRSSLEPSRSSRSPSRAERQEPSRASRSPSRSSTKLPSRSFEQTKVERSPSRSFERSRPRSSVDKDRARPTFDKNRSAFENRSRPTFDKNRSTFENRSRPTFDKNRSTFENRSRPAFEKERSSPRSTFENRSRPTFEKGRSSPRSTLENRSRPTFEKGRSTLENRSRPTFEKERSNRSSFGKERSRPSFEKQRSTFEGRSRPSFEKKRSTVDKERSRPSFSERSRPESPRRVARPMEPQLRSDQIDKPSEARVEKPQFQAPRSLDRVFAKARKRSSDQLERKKLRTLQLPVIKKFSVTERQGEPTPAALEALKQLSGKNRIVLGWQDLARDLLSRVGRPTDDESVAKLAHQLGPYFDQPFDQQEYAVQQDPEYAESLLNQAKQEFAALDVDEIVDHLDMIS